MRLEMGPLLALVGPGYEGQSFAPKTCFIPSAQSRVFRERAVICDPHPGAPAALTPGPSSGSTQPAEAPRSQAAGQELEMERDLGRGQG